MKALILRTDPQATVETAQTLLGHGFQILSVDTLAVAHALIRIDMIDLLVLDERIDGQLTHAIALSGERRNPRQSAIILTDRSRDETDDLFELIPCLYCLAGARTTASLLGELAVAAVSGAISTERMDQTVTDEAQEGSDRVAPLLLTQHASETPTDDSESGAPCYADVAIAAPAMAEIVAHETALTVSSAAAQEHARPCDDRRIVLDSIDDALDAEIAALFGKHPLLNNRAVIPVATANAG